MRILIFGATGRTGRELVRQALELGHSVSAYTRSPERIAGQDSSLRVIQGSVADAEAVFAAVAGHDAVVSVLGVGRPLKHDQAVIDGVGHIVSAMTAQGVRRLVYQSFIGGSGLDWTIVRPPKLTEGAYTGTYRAAEQITTRKPMPMLSRADAADFILRSLGDRKTVGTVIRLLPGHRS